MTKPKQSRCATLHDKRATLESNVARLFAIENPTRKPKSVPQRSRLYDLVVPSTASCSPVFNAEDCVPEVVTKEKPPLKQLQLYVADGAEDAKGAEKEADKPTSGKGSGKKRGPYKTWVKNDFLPLIHAAVVRTGSIHRAVDFFQSSKGGPGGVKQFKNLSYNTVKAWYQPGTTKLTPSKQAVLDGIVKPQDFRKGIYGALRRRQRHWNSIQCSDLERVLYDPYCPTQEFEVLGELSPAHSDSSEEAAYKVTQKPKPNKKFKTFKKI